MKRFKYLVLFLLLLNVACVESTESQATPVEGFEIQYSQVWNFEYYEGDSAPAGIHELVLERSNEGVDVFIDDHFEGNFSQGEIVYFKGAPLIKISTITSSGITIKPD